MTPSDLTAFARELATESRSYVADYVQKAVAVVSDRLTARVGDLEQRIAAAPQVQGPPGEKGEQGQVGQPGRDGKDADPEQIKAAVDMAVTLALANLHVTVRDEVAKAFSILPTPQHGRDGKDADLSLLLTMKADIASMQGEWLAFKAWQAERHQLSVVVDPAHVEQFVQKHLETRQAPTVDEAGLVARVKAAVIESIPTPKDGRDGKDGTSIDPSVVDVMVKGAVEQAVRALPPPKDGTSVTLADVQPLVTKEVAAAFNAWPKPKDGTSVSVDDVRPVIAAEVEAAAKAIPTPKDGKSVSVDDVRPLIAAEVASAVQAIPPPKDGKSVTVDEVRPVIAFEVAEAIKSVPTPKDGRDGIDGKDGASVSVDDVRPLIADEVQRTVASLPAPKDGKDGRDGVPGKSVDADAVDAMIQAHVTKAVQTIPAPKDGQSVTVEDVRPLIVGEVQKAVDTIPRPKDGVSVVETLINRDGHLILTYSDGATKDVGRIVGQDADPAAVNVKLSELVEQFPKPKDGKDGLGFEDLDLIFDKDTGWKARLTRGDLVKEYDLGIPWDAGVWQSGKLYHKGACVTRDGSLWIAQTETFAKPGDSRPEGRAWRLAVKAGRDAKRDG